MAWNIGCAQNGGWDIGAAQDAGAGGALNNFNTTPARNGLIVYSTISAAELVSLLETDAYFDNISKISRVDLTYTHEDGRQKKTFIHVGYPLVGWESWSPTAKDGTWQMTELRARDTDGAIIKISRGQLTGQDIVLS